MTLGDVLAAVGGLLALCASAWTLCVAVALLFPQRANLAADSISANSWKNGLAGFATTVVLGPMGVIVFRSGIPLSRLVGIVFFLALMLFAAIGVSGIAVIASRRIRQLDPQVNPFTALCRGSIFVVVPCLLPILGWFLLAPAMFFVGVGGGMRALKASVTAPQPFIF